MRAAGAPGAAPQRRPPTSISTSTSSVAPALAAAASSSATLSASSAHTPTFARRASAANRSSLAAPATSLETSTSAMPPSTIASASDTFWQHTPTAPSATCFAAMTGDLCVLACARSRTPARPTKSAIRLRLRSKASRSIRSAGVSISASGAPILAGGGGDMALLPAVSEQFEQDRRAGGFHNPQPNAVDIDVLEPRFNGLQLTRLQGLVDAGAIRVAEAADPCPADVRSGLENASMVGGGGGDEQHLRSPVSVQVDEGGLASRVRG